MKTLLTIFATSLTLLIILQLTAPADTHAAPPDAAEPVVERRVDAPRQGIALAEPAPVPSLATPVDLILYGTLVNGDGAAFAMIAESGSKTAFNYQPGDMLPGGSTLEMVTDIYATVSDADGVHALEMLSTLSMSAAEKAAIRDSLAASARSAKAQTVSLSRAAGLLRKPAS